MTAIAEFKIGHIVCTASHPARWVVVGINPIGFLQVVLETERPERGNYWSPAEQWIVCDDGAPHPGLCGAVATGPTGISMVVTPEERDDLARRGAKLAPLRGTA